MWAILSSKTLRFLKIRFVLWQKLDFFFDSNPQMTNLEQLMGGNIKTQTVSEALTSQKRVLARSQICVEFVVYPCD